MSVESKDWLKKELRRNPLSRSARNDFHFKYHRPLLASNEKPVMLWVISDSVEDRLGVHHLIVGQQSGEIDPGNDVSVLWRNSSDHVGMPDIRVDLAFDKLEFIEVIDGDVALFDNDVARFLEGSRIAEPQRSAAIAGDEFSGGTRHTPALAGVRKLLDGP